LGWLRLPVCYLIIIDDIVFDYVTVRLPHFWCSDAAVVSFHCLHYPFHCLLLLLLMMPMENWYSLHFTDVRYNALLPRCFVRYDLLPVDCHCVHLLAVIH